MNILGTQIADLVAYPIARHVLDPQKANPAFDIVKPKLVCLQNAPDIREPMVFP
jgi:hypothetical protein